MPRPESGTNNQNASKTYRGKSRPGNGGKGRTAWRGNGGGNGNGAFMCDGLRSYLRQVEAIPFVTPDEEQELGRRVMEDGDEQAAHRLVNSHLQLVVKIAKEMHQRWRFGWLDLIQEGNAGLVRAAHRFDPTKGQPFRHYASYWVRAHILKYIMDNYRMVKLGTTTAQRRLFFNLNKERRRILADGTAPDSEHVAKELNLNPDDVVEMAMRMDSPDLSLNKPVNDDNPSTYLDRLCDESIDTEEIVQRRQATQYMRDKLHDLWPTFSNKEADILRKRLLSEDPMTLRELGELHGVSRERIRQVEGRLLQKLRGHMAGSQPVPPNGAGGPAQAQLS